MTLSSTKLPTILCSAVNTGVINALYHKNVIDHYEHPRNVGTLDKNDPNVGTGIVGSPACGDVMKLQIKVNPFTDVNHELRDEFATINRIRAVNPTD